MYHSITVNRPKMPARGHGGKPQPASFRHRPKRQTEGAWADLGPFLSSLGFSPIYRPGDWLIIAVWMLPPRQRPKVNRIRGHSRQGITETGADIPPFFPPPFIYPCPPASAGRFRSSSIRPRTKETSFGERSLWNQPIPCVTLVTER